MEIISSRQNAFVKKLIALDTKKGRNEQGEFIVEGENFVFSHNEYYPIKTYCFSQSYYEGEKWKNYTEEPKNLMVLKDDLFNKISDTVNPQGVLAVLEKRTFNMEELLKKENPFFILAENLNDPGNLGTIIRTADAAGADGVILSKGSVDIYNRKTVRAAAGSVFNIPVIGEADLKEVIELFSRHGIITIAAHLKGKIYPYDINLKKGCAIIIGNEANGLSDDISEKTDCLVKLPIKGKAESLNASIAGGVLLYEVLRQRL